jgi:hypothetical protein
MLTVGLGDETPASVVDVAPLVLRYLGAEVPGYAVRRAA